MTFEIPQIGQDMVAVMVTAPYTLDVSGGPNTENWLYVLNNANGLNINNTQGFPDNGLQSHIGSQPTIGFTTYDQSSNVYVGAQLTVLGRFGKKNLWVNPGAGPGPILSDPISGGNYLNADYVKGVDHVLFVPGASSSVPAGAPYFQPTNKSLYSQFSSGYDLPSLINGATAYPQRHRGPDGKVYYGLATTTHQYLYVEGEGLAGFRVYNNPGIVGFTTNYFIAGPVLYDKNNDLAYLWDFDTVTGKWTFTLMNTPAVVNGAYGLYKGAGIGIAFMVGGWFCFASSDGGAAPAEIIAVHWSGGGYIRIKVYPGDVGAESMYDLNWSNFAVDPQGYLYWSAGAAPYGVGVVDSGQSFMVSDVPVFTPKFFKFFPGGMNSNSSAMGHFRMNWRKR